MEQLMRGDARVEGAQTALQRLRRRWKTEFQLFQVRNEMCECGTPDERMEEAEKARSSNEPKLIRLMKKRGQVRRAEDSRLVDHNVAVKEIVQTQRLTLELGRLGGDAGERYLFLRKIHGRARSI